ncbi:hemin uptake protein HemP [Pacificibacter maritimus]|uniref:Hemin uptake protein HemP n=1 Tax=Pacificibacter maritimus TaxID=762213 RepID=A0A3N4UA53_9RHOB|nr:hemin uptake protein HemP [Pacificibacter maritimus]RPE67342.1 hemin uptake protein HemP [Pacificibacter maritimus]
MSTPPAKTPTADLMHSLPTYQARELTENGEQALIVMENQVYTLRITRAGKLILTK